MPLTQLSTFRQELRHPRFRQPSLALLLQPFPRLRDDLLDAWFEEPQCLDFDWMDDGWKEKIIWKYIMNRYFEHIILNTYMKIWRTWIKSMVERMVRCPKRQRSHLKIWHSGQAHLKPCYLVMMEGSGHGQYKFQVWSLNCFCLFEFAICICLPRASSQASNVKDKGPSLNEYTWLLARTEFKTHIVERPESHVVPALYFLIAPRWGSWCNSQEAIDSQTYEC